MYDGEGMGASLVHVGCVEAQRLSGNGRYLAALLRMNSSYLS